MAEESENTAWPTPKFHFVVEIAGVAANLSFQEASGLDTGTKSITLKRGIFAKDNKLFDWIVAAKLDRATRTTITIKLLDESGSPTMAWKLANAWPKKVASPDLNASANEVAVDTLELAHEGITMTNA
jgi:hypothetical protein